MRTRHSIAVLVALLAVVALSGCAVFRVEPSALQSDTIGDVIVHVDVCASNIGTCPATGSADADSSGNQYDLQMLLGFLIPDGVNPPASFDTSSGPAGSFARSDSYSGGLESLSPAPAGRHWVGYAATSTYHWKGNANPATEFTADPQFGLPPGADGSPFRGAFEYSSVVGIRAIDGTHPLSAPVDCVSNANTSGTLCSEHPSGAPAFGSDLTIPTRDLGVVGSSAPATVNPGGTVSVPFNLRYAGAATPGAAFALSAVSDLPGAAPPSLSQSALTPGSDSDNNVLATVSVPPGTAIGNYAVELSARLPNGQTRRGTSAISVIPVTAPPPGGSATDTKPPVARLAIRRVKLGALLHSRRLVVRASLNEAGNIRLSLKVPAKPRATLHATVSFARAGSHNVTLRLSRHAAATLGGHRRLALEVSGSARDLAGNVSAASAHRAFRR